MSFFPKEPEFEEFAHLPPAAAKLAWERAWRLRRRRIFFLWTAGCVAVAGGLLFAAVAS